MCGFTSPFFILERGKESERGIRLEMGLFPLLTRHILLLEVPTKVSYGSKKILGLRPNRFGVRRGLLPNDVGLQSPPVVARVRVNPNPTRGRRREGRGSDPFGTV